MMKQLTPSAWKHVMIIRYFYYPPSYDILRHLLERIDEIIKSKKALPDNIIGTGEGWLTEMTTEQLKDIFILRREAVVYE